MIIPSIDLQGGQAVQLVNGERLALEAGDPAPLASMFGRVGPIAVIDLDAAMGKGSNADIIHELIRSHRCRVGGGIRDIETAIRWLDAGAEHVIIGTAATVEFVQQLPKERVIVALDTRHNEVVVEGWRSGTGTSAEERMLELRDYVDGFLVTFVENEGLMQGTQLDRVASLKESAGSCHLTIAGGVTTKAEIASLDDAGADAQVGMALYTGRLTLAQGFSAPVTTDRQDGLWPTIVVDEFDRALGLCYSNLQSLEAALESGSGVYWSRSRGLWRKGKTSGARQELLSVSVDCDRDTLRFKVRQHGPGFCHLDRCSCFGDLGGIPRLSQRLRDRADSAPAGSYTRRLLEDDTLLGAKVVEEAYELVAARTPQEVTSEAADVLYFTLVTLARHRVPLDDVVDLLNRRSLHVTRRPGLAKNLDNQR